MADQPEVIAIDVPTPSPSNWDDFEKLLHHGFYNEMRVAPEEVGVIMSESSFSDPAAKEKITQILFETFNVPGCAIIPTSVLGIFCLGKETGLSIHLGETRTEIVPVVDNIPLRDAAVVYPVTGAHVTSYLRQIIEQKGFTWSAGMGVEAKPGCYASLNPTTEGVPVNTVKIYNLSSGEDVDLDLGSAGYLAVEGILYPEYFSVAHDPLVLTIAKVVSQCPPHTHHDLLSSISLSGGNASFKGLAKRIENDLKLLLGQDTQVRVIAEPEPKYSPWVGLSILGSLSTFVNTKLLMKDTYDEFGPTAIHTVSV